MKPRTGLYVALIGLVIAVPCGVAALPIANLSSGPPENWSDYMIPAALLACFGLFIGFILMLVGLARATGYRGLSPSSLFISFILIVVGLALVVAAAAIGSWF